MSTGTRLRLGLLIGVVFLIVLAGCVQFERGDRGDPTDDSLGFEDGYWHDDPLSLSPDDGLNATEREALVARTMARLEILRGLEFRDSVNVSVISREQYRANRSGSSADSAHNRWNDQVWEGLFLVGEDASFAEVMDSTLGTSVLGYYAPDRDEIVIVSDSASPSLSRSTLVHELVHALQDQHFGLNGTQPTQDTQLAVDGLVEGEATLLQRQYESRCGEDWQCPSLAATNAGGSVTTAGGTSDYRSGVFTVVYQPYASGPSFVRTLEARGGWSAVDAAHDRLPESTEQIIHPEAYPDERPVSVSIPDRSGSAWSRFDLDPVGDTVGEASIYAMFAVNGVTTGPGSLYEYVSDPATGWGGDTLVPYRDGERYGYVWKTSWETEADAREFSSAYRDLLTARDARTVGDGLYVLPETDPFGDAFSLRRHGTDVTIVNGPDPDAVGSIHPPQ